MTLLIVLSHPLQVALYSYLDGSDVGKGGLKFLTGAKILTEMYRKLTEKETLLEGLRVSLEVYIYVKGMCVSVRVGALFSFFYKYLAQMSIGFKIVQLKT